MIFNPFDDIDNFRTIDGTGNNLISPTFNNTNSDFTRIAPKVSGELTSGLPDPRTISNVIVGQGDPNTVNPEGLSDFMYAWGQFIDHDLDLEQNIETATIPITIPVGDPSLPAGGVIPLQQAATDPANGNAINTVTGWLDASQVYGSDAATAANLRLPDGHMKTSDGNNLPIDPVTGQFMAGDVRAQENPSLTSLQTLFLREHNFQVDKLHLEHPYWTGDQLYDHARAIVGAEIANITYSAFLPHLLGPMAPGAYLGYDASVDPRITEEFAGAAYRFGHSIVSGDLARLDNNGVSSGELALQDAFFIPPAQFEANGGADGFLRHLGSESSNALDVRIVDDLRNFLLDPPDTMDLAAINIQRGRDFGLGSFNQERIALGLVPYTAFDQITSDPGTLAALQQVYTSVDQIDLWVGGLSENHVPGALIGQTFGTIIARQFENLRDGDRLYWQNQGFDPATAAEIGSTTLSQIIERNTDTGVMQADAFVTAQRHTTDADPDDPNAPQLIIGTAGRDTLVGGEGNDTLVAAAGRQLMVGLGGADDFVFPTFTTATVADFNVAQDRIVLVSTAGLQLTQAAAGAMISGGGLSITLRGVAADQLTDANFAVDPNAKEGI